MATSTDAKHLLRKRRYSSSTTEKPLLSALSLNPRPTNAWLLDSLSDNLTTKYRDESTTGSIAYSTSNKQLQLSLKWLRKKIEISRGMHWVAVTQIHANDILIII